MNEARCFLKTREAIWWIFMKTQQLGGITFHLAGFCYADVNVNVKWSTTNLLAAQIAFFQSVASQQ